MRKLTNGAVQHFVLDAPAAPGYIFIVQCSMSWLRHSKGKVAVPNSGRFL
jgi:hypothetical protein